MKNDKKKDIKIFCRKKCYCLETSIFVQKERNAELEAESVSLQEIFNDGTKEVKGLKDKVTKLQQDKEEEASNVSSIKIQVKDQKQMCKEKETEDEKLNEENQQMKQNK